MFVMENVPNILLLSEGEFRDDILLGFRRAGYANVVHIRLSATDFLVPQHRHRIFFFGTRDDLGLPSDLRPFADAFLSTLKVASATTVREAIGDLPADVVPSGRTLPYPAAQIHPSDFLRRMRLDLGHGPFTQEAKQRRAASNEPTVLHNHHTKEIGCRRAELISHLAPGEKGDSLPGHLWHGVRPGKWRRLHPDRPSHAILAHADRDLSEWIHPEFDRWITVREAARLQGFHDGWIFCSSESQMLRQIGNAVPPPVGYAVGKLALAILSSEPYTLRQHGGRALFPAAESKMLASKTSGRGKTNPHADWVSLAEFRKLVQKYYGTRTLMFDADLARAVLEEFNTGNRRVNQRKVTQLADQMRSGEFENTGEPLIISAEGVLNDGQHRLFALVEAGAEIDMDVRFGIPRRAFSKTDTGMSRNPADVLTILGVRHGSDIARAVRLLILHKRGLPESVRSFVSNDEIARAFDCWKDIADVAEQVSQHVIPRSIRGAALLATAYMASRSPAKAQLDAWLEILATGLGAARDNPAYVARERILRANDAPVGTRELLLERLGMLIKSWNSFADNRSATVRELTWKPGGRKANEFPGVQGAELPALQ
jgi:site-specific DNA-cytosine methylase